MWHLVVKERDQRIEALLDVNTRYSIETVLPYTCLIFQDDSNRSLLSEKKFSKECIRCCVLQNKTMSSIEVGEVTKLLFHNLCSNFLMRGRGSWKPIWLLIFQKCTLLYIFIKPLIQISILFDINCKIGWFLSWPSSTQSSLFEIFQTKWLVDQLLAIYWTQT